MEKIKKNRNALLIIGAIVILAIVFFATKGDRAEVVVNDDALTDELGLVEGDAASSTEIPMPEDWETQEVSGGALTLDIPTEYFVSKPRIAGCDATSISTTQNGKPVSVAFVYDVGCQHPDLQVGYAHRIERNGYIFRTNYNSPSVLAVFEKIVNSAN
jgi:hypothetical protein